MLHLPHLRKGADDRPKSSEVNPDIFTGVPGRNISEGLPPGVEMARKQLGRGKAGLNVGENS